LVNKEKSSSNQEYKSPDGQQRLLTGIIGANKSILEYSDPKKLIDNFAGTGKKVKGNTPGVAGYIEVVNFNEFIGYAVDRETGKKVATSWGKIHYAKDGLHIVPIKPRG
jgi:filamentous hemagglutinin